MLQAYAARMPGIGLGTFPFSGVFSPVDSAQVNSILDKFFDVGGWYIETAPLYAPNGIDLGVALKRFRREQFFISTKCVAGRDADGATIRSGKPEHLRRQCHAELRRLKVDELDLLQMHNIPEDAPFEESYGTLAELQRAGLVRYIGASNVTLTQLTELQKIAQVDFVQNRFSFIHRRDHRAIEPFCAEHGVLLNPYQIIERGLLTDTPKSQFRAGDLRNSKYEYSGDVYHYIRSWTEENLTPIARENGLSTESLVIRWSLSQPAIGVIPVGATDPTQVVRNLEAVSEAPLSQRVVDQMEDAYVQLADSLRARVGLTIDEYRKL